MSFLGKGRKNDLIELANELGEIIPPEAVVVTIKNIIINSKNYEESFVKEVFERIIEERLKREENEKLEKERLQLIAEQEKQQLLEIQDREKQRLLEIEDREKQRNFELQKLRLLNENRVMFPTSTESNITMQENKKCIDLKGLMQKFDLKDGDISSFLIIFERQAKRVGLSEDDYVFHLLGLLPPEITQLIARESEEQANEYAFVKNLLLRRFKLSPEKFRQKFVNHNRDSKNTWTDFVFEIRNYFNEWLSGLKINDFDSLKELIVVDQLKKRVPNFMREHFIDSWPNYVNANELAGKLDEYENVRSGIGIKNSNEFKSNPKLWPREDPKNIPRVMNYGNSDGIESKFENRETRNNKYCENDSSPTYKCNDTQKLINSSIRNEQGEPKCYSCNLYGHISRFCQNPCKICGIKGHAKKFCPQNKKETILNVRDRNDSFTAPSKYLRNVLINDSRIFRSCYLDTAASACLLKQSVAKRERINISSCEKDLFGFGSQNYPTKSLGAAIVDLKIDDVTAKDIPVLIVPDSAQPVDLLVGRTFLDLPYIAYARVGDNLHIGYAKDYPFIELDCVEENSCIKLKADETTKIINNSVNFVKVKTEQINNELVMIQGNEGNLNSLLEIKEGKTALPIVNIGDNEITLKENQNIGKAELVDEVNSELNSNNFNSLNDDRSVEILNVNVTNVERKPITLEQIKFNENLTEQQQQDLVKLLNDFRDCFALNVSESGCTLTLYMIIKMLIKEIEQLTNSLQEKDKDLLLKQKKTDSLNATVNQMKMTVDNLKEKLQQADTELSLISEDNSEKVNELLEEVNQLKQEKECIVNEYEGKLQQEQEELYAKIRELESVKNANTEQKSELMQQLSGKRQELAKLGSETEEAIESCKKLSEENDHLTSSLKGKDLVISDMKKQIEELKSSLDTHLKEKEEKEKKLLSLQGIIKSKEEENTSISSKLQLAEQKVEMLNKDSCEHVMSLQKELTKLKEESTALKCSLRVLIDIFKKEKHERTKEEKQKIANYVFKRSRVYRRICKKGKEKLCYVIPKSMRKSTAVDHLGPFVKSSKGNQDLLIMIDNFTRFTRLFPVKNTSSQHVLKALKSFVDEFVTTSMSNSRHKDWDSRIKETERNLNNTVNKTTDKTPFELLHGYSPRLKDGILRKVADESVDRWTNPKEVQEETRNVIEKKQCKMKEYYDKKKCRTMTFEPGEIVVVRRPLKPTGEPAKTQPKYRGPLIVTEVLPSDTYRVTQLEEREGRRFYTTTAHVSQLKSWHVNDLDESDDEEQGNSQHDSSQVI